SCILFIVIALVHLYLNWRVFLRYFKSKVEQGFCLKREFLLACVVCGLFVAGSIWYLSPFNTVFNIREDFKFAHDPVFTREQLPGAEELTLARLAGQIGVKPEEMAGVLKENGLKVENPKATVSEIATQNGLPPAAVYEAVYLKYGQSGHPVTRFTGLNPEGRGEGRGRGFGRMTLSELCAQQGLKTETAIASLQNRGVQATEFSTLRDLSLALGTTPREVLQIVQTDK
ncbi:MAG TPA: hypothetical protein VM123_06015, partial [archaeon]|nr:hypothetical protein [archaeon]